MCPEASLHPIPLHAPAPASGVFSREDDRWCIVLPWVRRENNLEMVTRSHELGETLKLGGDFPLMQSISKQFCLEGFPVTGAYEGGAG